MVLAKRKLLEFQAGRLVRVLISITQWPDLAFRVNITQCSHSCFVCINSELGSERIQALKYMPRHPESRAELMQKLTVSV